MNNNKKSDFNVGFAPIARIVYLLIIGVVIGSIWQLSFGWSLGETTKFSSLAIGGEYAEWVSYLVQFGPNMFLLLTPLIKRGTVRNLFAIIALSLNFIDMATNIGAYTVYRANTPVAEAAVTPWIGDMANGIGWILCIMITWGEEAMIYMVGLGFQVLANLYEDWGRKPPAWFRADVAKYAAAASGAQALGLGYDGSDEPPIRRQQQPPQTEYRFEEAHARNSRQRSPHNRL